LLLRAFSQVLPNRFHPRTDAGAEHERSQDDRDAKSQHRARSEAATAAR